MDGVGKVQRGVGVLSGHARRGVPKGKNSPKRALTWFLSHWCTKLTKAVRFHSGPCHLAKNSPERAVIGFLTHWCSILANVGSVHSESCHQVFLSNKDPLRGGPMRPPPLYDYGPLPLQPHQITDTRMNPITAFFGLFLPNFSLWHGPHGAPTLLWIFDTPMKPDDWTGLKTCCFGEFCASMKEKSKYSCFWALFSAHGSTTPLWTFTIPLGQVLCSN